MAELEQMTNAPSSSRGSGDDVVPDDLSHRRGLEDSLFDALDADGDGALNNAEMLAFAVRMGFEGGESDWSDLFDELCQDQDANSNGVTKALFTRLLNDKGHAGCYLTLEKLHNMCRDLVSAKSRKKVATARRVKRGRP